MKKKILLLLLMLVALLIMGCNKKLELFDEKEQLEKYFPNLSINNGYWYVDYKNKETVGIGPNMYIMYGIAKLEQEYLNEIKDNFEWEKSNETKIFEYLYKNNFNKVTIMQDNYVISEDFNKYYKDNYPNVLQMTYYDITLMYDFENNTIVYYMEFAFN